MKKIGILIVLCLFAVPVLADDLSLEQILDKVQAQQGLVQDMYAETTTSITSNLQLPNSKGQTGPQKMVQKSRMWTKGKDKTRVEMLSPTKQTTITNGDLMTIINPETGQTMTQDMSKLGDKGIGGSGNQGGMDLAKAKEYFNLSVKKSGKNYIVSGVPRQDNKFLTRLDFEIDSERWVPVTVRMYGTKNKLMNESKIEYQYFDKPGVYLPVKNFSRIDTPMGKMEVEMTYDNVKVNSGLKDKLFEGK